MDDAHTLAAIRYLALNPVSAKLVARAEDWRWSSAAGCMGHTEDKGTPSTVSPFNVAAVLERTGPFGAFLYGDPDPAATFAAVAKASSTGRPVGSAEWLRAMEAQSGRTLIRGKPGRK